MPYIYDCGDNSPMNEEAWQHEKAGDDDRHCDICKNHDGKYCQVWDCKFEPKEEPLPFTDPPDGCWNCMQFDWNHEACTVNWNNMDESYYNPDCDDRNPDDHCEYWELNPDAKWEDWH